MGLNERIDEFLDLLLKHNGLFYYYNEKTLILKTKPTTKTQFKWVGYLPTNPVERASRKERNRGILKKEYTFRLNLPGKNIVIKITVIIDYNYDDDDDDDDAVRKLDMVISCKVPGNENVLRYRDLTIVKRGRGKGRTVTITFTSRVEKCLTFGKSKRKKIYESIFSDEDDLQLKF
jgi:hypothetical protein